MSNHASIRSEGGLLPADLLSRIRARDPALTGLRPEDYALAPGETLNEAASRSWARLTGLWRKFSKVLKSRTEGDAFEGETLDRWLKPLFQELGFDGLERVRAETIGRDTFAISHRWKALPVHLIGAGLLIDKRTPGARGAATANPHGLLQDYLNRKDEYLWGIVSNGLKLRLLRDNRTLTRQAYLEFNLENIFSAEGQSGYADFFLLWLICHRTRFDAPGGGDKAATTPAPHSAWIIEVWTKAAGQSGVRAQLGLRQNAVRALNHLGSGFLGHRANDALRQRLQHPGRLSRDDFKRQLLRTLYRLLFLFVAEDRGLLLEPNASPAIRARFTTYYSTARLRRVARRYGGTAHGDGWVQLQTLFRLLRVDAGCPALGLPPLGGFLFSEGSCPDLDVASLANEHLYAALRALCVVQDREERITRVTDFEHLGAEELGGIYESLLELGFKEWSVPAGLCELADAPGNERKLTGSYYTPTSLITVVLDTALDPVMDRAVQEAREAADKTAKTSKTSPSAAILNPQLSTLSPSQGEVGDSHLSTINHQLAEALLRLRICDPACGSGHFLVAAAHRLARRIAALRTGEREPPVDAVRHALREVAARCLYGVDVNPLSVELCKVSIWLEALEPGCPLAFLESHIQCGNSLLGCTPALLKKGLPDEAFKSLAGDDPAAVRALIKDNRDARDAKQDIFDLTNRPALTELARLPDAFLQVEALPDDSPEAVRQKESRWTTAIRAGQYQHEMFLHDAWCAAFVLPRRKDDFTYQFHTGHLRKLAENPADLSPELRDAIERLAGNAPHLTESERERSYRFFHWHLRFPSVFRASTLSDSPCQSGAMAGQPPASTTGWEGGFDVVLGNPPWERVKLQVQEWFAGRHDKIVDAQTSAARDELIAELKTTDPTLYGDFIEASRKAEGESHLLRDSGCYPLCGVGDVNTFAVFSELNITIASAVGRAGFIVPFGIATQENTSAFFDFIISKRRLASLLQMENLRKLFPAIHPDNPFVLITITGHGLEVPLSTFIFCAETIEDLAIPERQIELTPEDIIRINPNTRTCPVFKTRRDADITRAIYRRVPVLLLEARGNDEPEVNPWRISLLRMFDTSNDSNLFITRPRAEADGWEPRGNKMFKGQDTLLPLHEAKLFHQFDHRWATYLDTEDTRELASGEKTDPAKLVMPRYWVDERDCLTVVARVGDALRAAIWMVWRPQKEKDHTEGPTRLRRELGRWLAGWRLLNDEAEAGAQLLRHILADANKKRTEKKWREEEETARTLALAYELTPAEATTIAGILDAPLLEQITALWPLLRVRVPTWFFAYRRITNATNARTSIFTATPWSAFGDLSPVCPAFPRRRDVASLIACCNSFAFDYLTRQKVSGTHLDFYQLYQLATLPPETYAQPPPWAPSVTLAEWLRPYVLELCFTAHDLAGFAEDCGHAGPPFRWDDSRRAQLRAELDAAFFHLYGLNRSDTEYVISTFDLLKRRELSTLGKFETAERVLAAYDVMATAISGGSQFTTQLDPPPAHPSQEHGITHYPRKPMNARITRATISNYRSLAGPWNDPKRQKENPLTPSTVTLGQVTVLVGPNDSGKSSFCDALAFISDTLRNGLRAAVDNGDNRRGFASLRRQGGDAVSIRIDIEADGLAGYYELEISGSADGYRVAREAAKWRGAFAIRNGEWEEGGRLENASLQTGPTALQLVALRADPRFVELADFLSRMVVYSVPPIELRKPHPKSPASPMDGRGNDWPSALDHVLASPSAGALIVALNRLTGDIVNIRVKNAGTRQYVEFLHREPEATEGGRWSNADQESDGTLRAAALLTALTQEPPPSLIAIEEPELAIHPGALTILYDAIQSAQRKAQILITTHSPDLLDHFEADLLRVVCRDGDATRITGLDEDQHRAVRERLTTLGDVMRHEGMRPNVS